ncbi:MAG: SAM-dependent DNA methyltransferase [Prevotella sp.]|nr:SAM-dependent DNA methyltransferase [Prevotella sp.]
MITEKEYIKKISIGHRKKYAQYFTPEQISDFMALWVLGGKKGKLDILEPAFGLGVFSRSLYKLNPQIRVVGYDIDRTIYTYANQIFVRPQYDVSINNEDYITASWTDKFDGIICNPPYLKFHDYDNATLIPIVNSKLHTHLNGFTNIYTLFLLKSIFQMKDGARMAYIIPSEFLNSDYGVEVKRSLIQSGVLKHVIIVDFTQCAFDDALTTACILLCENDKSSDSVHFSNINNVSELYSSLAEYKTFASRQLNPEVKWKQYYEDTKSSKYNDLVPFSTFAKVSRGIATGANDYFTFKASKIDQYNIPEKAFRRCVCHSADVKNQIFTEDDFESLVNHDKAVFLFNGCANENEPYVQNYIRLGEEIGIDKKYLTASRTPWYALESRQPSPIWVSVFNRNGLRFVRNKAGVYNLTTFHCVYNSGVIDTDILFAYLVTNVAKEILLDNSRQYGNGLVKFEPNDLNKGNVVDLRKLSTEEKKLVLRASKTLHHYGSLYNQTIAVLDDFFSAKYTNGATDLISYSDRIERIVADKPIVKEKKVKADRIKQLNFLDLFDQYEFEPIAQNSMVYEDIVSDYNTVPIHLRLPMLIDNSKNILICNVKRDNWEQYHHGSAKIYYTGKRFPSTVALNKLYYFMPYLPGKGVRDLYYIKIARLGFRKEGQENEDKNDLRLVFEIERLGQLFEDYKKIKLEIWRTFTDTNIEKILQIDDDTANSSYQDYQLSILTH